jgi:hypothetical protein
LEWHRGLLTLGVPRSIDTGEVADVLPWVDSAVFTVVGIQGLVRVADMLSVTALNHLVLDIRRPLSDEGGRPRAAPTLSGEFLARPLREAPACRGLTHLACSHAWDPQAGLIRSFGVEPASANARLWMHRQPPPCFGRRPATATS